MHGTSDTAQAYWEDRAQRFAGSHRGLPAVCSYGMPRFYNESIEVCQARALAPWLDAMRGQSVLELGCGVGRWTEALVQRDCQVTGVDLSPTMIARARERLADSTPAPVLAVADVVQIDLDQQFDAVLSVTVLQHVLDDQRFDTAIANVACHLKPGGRAVLLEAAPTLLNIRCNTRVFCARTLNEYNAALAQHDLRLVEVTGVDPAPFKTWLLPHYKSLPRLLANSALYMATLAARPVDRLLARRLPALSWHKVMVAEKLA